MSVSFPGSAAGSAEVKPNLSHRKSFLFILKSKDGLQTGLLVKSDEIKNSLNVWKGEGMISAQDILNVLTREGSQLLGRAALENICCVKLRQQMQTLLLKLAPEPELDPLPPQMSLEPAPETNIILTPGKPGSLHKRLLTRVEGLHGGVKADLGPQMPNLLRSLRIADEFGATRCAGISHF